MSETEAPEVKVEVPVQDTKPSDPSRRIPDDQIEILPCEPSDAEHLADLIYTSLSDEFWDRVEPLSLRPPRPIRLQRMAKRILPSLSEPSIKWIKAVSKSTNEILGAACWTAPGAPLHNYLRRSAIAPDVYDWQAKMNWTDAEVDEMWSGIDDQQWNVRTAENDALRQETFGDEAHWYLAPLCTWPRFQGRGVGKRLLMWAIEQADKAEPVQPLFLESAPSARVVYMHVGFFPVGERTAMMRRGPKVVEAEEVENA